MLKPYMHGYFISLKLYDAARVIANPFAYAEHREKLVRDKMEKMAETRIRSRKDTSVKVNKALAEKILKEEGRAKKREERRKAKKVAAIAAVTHGGEDAEMEGMEDESSTKKPSLLSDPRFAKVFEDPEFAIDENSREYALLNPSSIAQRMAKTAVEDEEEESDKMSSDGLGGSESESSNDSDDNPSEDSSDAGGTFMLPLGRSSYSLLCLQSFNLTLARFRRTIEGLRVLVFQTSI
jgi:ribosome biogenesis protein ENP2